MKEGHVFRSFTDTGNIYSQKILQNKTLENFLSHLKTSLDYEQVAIYIYDNITKDSNVDLIENALHFILNARFKTFDTEQYEVLKDTLFSYSDVVQVVQLTRVYKRHKEYHYLFVYSYLDGDELNIIIPAELNHCSLLGVPMINITSSELISSPYRKTPKYDDCNHFIEFKEHTVSYKRKLPFLHAVCEINMETNHISPILSNRIKTPYETVSYDRKAQLILTYHPEDYEFVCDYVVDISLIYKQQTIKRMSIPHRYGEDFDKIIEKFIFPLNETYNLISEWGLEPALTEEFMSKDYDDYWQLKEMVEL